MGTSESEEEEASMLSSFRGVDVDNGLQVKWSDERERRGDKARCERK